MNHIEAIKKRLVPESRWVETTGVTVINHFNYNLYNVMYSTNDPKYHSWTWKHLLQHYGIGVGHQDRCWVNNSNPPPAPGKSHPQFNVGGHVCTTSSRVIPDNGTCYLMPLCHQHNNDDAYQFTGFNLPILKLLGYDTGESAFTFKAKMEDEQPYSLVFSQNEEWHHQNISDEEAKNIKQSQSLKAIGFGDLEHYVLLKRQEQDGTKKLYVEATNL